MNPTLRGFLIIAAIAAVVVVLSLEEVLATVGGLLRIAFFLAIAFFLFLLWRERRSDIEAWSDLSQRVFYGAVILAVVDIGAFIGLSPSAPTRWRSSSCSARACTPRSGRGARSTATAEARNQHSTSGREGRGAGLAARAPGRPSGCRPSRWWPATRGSARRPSGGRRRGGGGARLPRALEPPVGGRGALLVLRAGRPARRPSSRACCPSCRRRSGGRWRRRSRSRTPRSRIEERLVAFGFLNAVQRLVRRQPDSSSRWTTSSGWIEPSLALLQYVLPRLDGAPVAVVLTARGETPSWLSRTEGLIELDLRPLSVGALHELLRARLDAAFSRPVLLRIWETSGGNPFFALELARALERRGGRIEPGAKLPVPETLEELVLERLETLTSGGARGLPSRRGVVRADDRGSSSSSSIRAPPASRRRFRARVLELDGARLRFTHPLLASAIAGRTVGEAKRSLHERLAAVALDPEEQARHLALAASGPSAKVAAALDAAARQARRSGRGDRGRGARRAGAAPDAGRRR